MYAASSEAFSNMSQSFIGEVVDLPAGFALDQMLYQLFSGSVVGEREVDFLVKQLFAVFHCGIKRLVCTGDHCHSIAF